MSNSVLICTVGGAHEPIIKAIKSLQPRLEFVCFLCSGRDPATHRPGSDVQITGKGLVIKQRPSDEKATLENIPSQCSLGENQFEVVEVPTDDLDGAFAITQQALLRLAERFPEHQWVADYTGGTKTMTAALALAALENDKVRLQLVTGARVDLLKVQSGMEAVLPASVERVRLVRAMRPFQAAWQRYAYGEAALGLAGLAMPQNRELGGQLCRWRDLSRAFDAWDRFDHAEAARLLEAYRNLMGRPLAPLFQAIGVLSDKAAGLSGKRGALLAWDLWLNAQRRAAQGRYDDAVARVYRFIEWTAQWLLWVRCGIDTADIPIDKVPPGIDLKAGPNGKIQAALFSAWDLVGRLTEGAAAQFIQAKRSALCHHIEVRNNSILAHGFEPIRQEHWATLSIWLEQCFLPMLRDEAKSEGIGLPPQLPASLP
jgi:CRISPR-associated protein (TIGR02710 family)